MKRYVLVLFSIAAVLAQGPGVRPRAAASDYPASGHGSGLTVGAAVLSKKAVRNAFATDLNRGYVVFEIGVYPDQGGVRAISPEDFMVKMPGEKAFTRPVEPPVIARSIQEQNEPKSAARSGPQVVSATNVGYITGGYDPNTGQKRKGTWVTESSVGLASGAPGAPIPPKGPYSDADRDDMAAELGDKSLPKVSLDQPVAGYLYFPVNKKRGSFELQYLGSEGSVKLAVPAQPGN